MDYKKFTMWVEIDPAHNDGRPLKPSSDKKHTFAGKNMVIARGATPGCVVAIDARQDRKSVWPSTARIISHWTNEEDVAEWNALHRAAEAEAAARGKALKGVKEALPFEMLAPFRHAYANARNSTQRSHILAWIIAEITRGW
jgi:hypothetical protein